jgi:hypothetical protein
MCDKITMRHNHEKMAEYILNVLKVVKDDEVLLEIFKNGLRNQIFDLGEIYTGYASHLAIETGLSKSKLTSEHMYPRNRSAIQIIDRVLYGKPITKSRLAAWIKSRCRVHITTKDENLALVQLQKDSNYYWRNGYREIGINLEKHEFGRKKKYIYKIHGIEYNSIQDAAQKYSITPELARYRCDSKSKKWTEWKKVKIE